MIPAVLIDGEKFDLIQELSLISEKVSQMVKLLKTTTPLILMYGVR